MQIMTSKEWFYLLRCLKQDDNLLFFPAPISVGKVMEDYVEIRDNWISEGKIALDFDGSVQMQREFYREVYNLTDWTSLTRLDSEEGSTLYVQGPVDFLKVTRESGVVKYESIKHTAFHDSLSDALGKNQIDSLTTKRHEDGAEVITDLTKCESGSEALKAELDKHMKLIYRRPEDEQPHNSNNRV